MIILLCLTIIAFIVLNILNNKHTADVISALKHDVIKTTSKNVYLQYGNRQCFITNNQFTLFMAYNMAYNK